MANLSNFLPQIGPRQIPSISAQNIDIVITAGEDLAIRDCVYIAGPFDVGKTAGQFYKCDSITDKSSSLAGFIGFATSAILTGATGTIRIAGILGGFSSLMAGNAQFISVSGAIADTVQNYSRLVGFAISSTEILINTAGAQTAVSYGGIRGYTFGGYIGSEMVVTCNRLTFSTDTMTTATTANLATAKYSSQGLSQGSTKGYVVGGYTGAFVYTQTAEKMTFSQEITTSQTTANLAQPTVTFASLSERSIKGYFAGGATSGAYISTTSKIVFSSDVNSAQTSADLSVVRYGLTGLTEGFTKGYFAGGHTSLAGAVTETTDKIVFSSDTTAAQTTANLSQARLLGGSGISGGGTKGYFAGGDTTSAGNAQVVTAEKITFSTDITIAQTSANLTLARSYISSMSEGIIKGYFCGGYTNNIATASEVTDKTVFATDITVAQTTANYPTGTYGASSFSDVGL